MPLNIVFNNLYVLFISSKKNNINLPKYNREIRASEVRLILSDGSMHGVAGIYEALRMADDQGLDLVEISPNASPPVCKIMDFGKYKYEEKKRLASNSSSNRKLKEIKMGVSISSHDLDIKLKHAEGFLQDGHSVRIVIQMRGRELGHKEVGYALMDKIVERVSLAGKLLDKVSPFGNTIVASFIPDKTKVK